ncbi:MAG: flagellar assembly protein FliW [Planctomycetota bacterium]
MDDQAVIKESNGEEQSGQLVFPTARFGEVTVAANTLLHFPRGMVGLPEARQFVFLHDEGTPGPVFWMQSIDDPSLAFLVCEPEPFFPGYEIELEEADQALLCIEQEAEALVCVLLVVPEDPSGITANLRGPVVINRRTRTGVQLILVGEEYSTRAPLFGGAAPGETVTEGGAECSS